MTTFAFRKKKEDSKSEKWTKKEKFLAILPVGAALLGSIITYTFTYFNSTRQNNFQIEQKQFDNQRVAYCKLMKLEITYGASITNFYDNQITMNCHMVEYRRYSHSIRDSVEYERHKGADLNNLNIMTSYQNELYETIGLVQTSFKMDKELQNTIDNILNYRTIDIPQISQDFKNRDEFIAFKHTLKAEAEDNEAIIYTFLDSLIKVLQKRLDIERFS